MAQGDAFNRSEVSSVYVGPKARFVVSLIVGVDEARTPEDAAQAALDLTRVPECATTIWCVHDRETGETHEIEQATFDLGSMVEPDPFKTR